MSKPPIHVMFDIETLGTGDRAPIVQLGAVMFSPFGNPSSFGAASCTPGLEDAGVISALGTEFRMNVAVTDHALRTADWPTIQWWLLREPEAQRRVFGKDTERHPIVQVLSRFAEWCRSWGEEPSFYWSDMDFDLRLMRQWYEYIGMRCPFETESGPHRGVRDFRTLRAIGKARGIEPAPFVGVKHDALDDAYHQAYYAAKVLRDLRVG